ncbi:junctional adhesion molecule 2b [Sardina pilchardus]|uniref:junctional adhesion molecule 2b n=1 Tax=Sardina pilchardus TaxID=27697 RepID=UPI002E145808
MDSTRLLAFPVLLALLHPSPTASVTVSTSKAKVVAHENSNAVLSCEFKTEKDPNPRIEWKKNGKGITFVYFEGNFREPYAGRATIDGATVTLHSVAQKDTGVYRCEVTAKMDHVPLGEINVTLSVLVPPHTPSCEVPETVLSGFAVELHCKDKLSVPAATYSWYKDNKALAGGHTPDSHYSLDTHTGTLKFKAVSKADAGNYRCESSNDVGPPKSCPGHKMEVKEFELSLPLLIAVGVGAFLLLVLCCLGACLCYRRGCCCCCRRRKPIENKQRRNYPNHSPPMQDPRFYKHTKSFMI